jgi:lipopolysaccharide/colanic/teichoic acid biosynthesis glycosyltransferase
MAVATIAIVSAGLLIGVLAESLLAARLAAPYQALAFGASFTLVCAGARVLWRSTDDRRLRPGCTTQSSAVPAMAGLSLVGLGTVLLADPIHIGPGALAAINFLLVMAAVSITGRNLQPVPRVLVIGDPDFHDQIVRAAGNSRRRIIGWVDSQQLKGDVGFDLSDERPPDGISYEEIVIQGECFGRLHDISPALRSVASRVLVLPRAAPNGTIAHRSPRRLRRASFYHPIPLWGRISKRLLDLAVGSIALLLASPVLLVAIVAILRDGPGAPIFQQQRLGLDGRRFTLYKLRTMTDGASDAEHRDYVGALIRGEGSRHQGLYKLTSDERITRVGKVIRRFSIDEIPQLWNVLRGEMSLVGPRPPLAAETELYDARACQRLRVKPGLTGLWQVRGRSQLGFEKMVELDTKYWQSWTPLLDLMILVRTPWVVVTGRGAA